MPMAKYLELNFIGKSLAFKLKSPFIFVILGAPSR